MSLCVVREAYSYCYWQEYRSNAVRCAAQSTQTHTTDHRRGHARSPAALKRASARAYDRSRVLTPCLTTQHKSTLITMTHPRPSSPPPPKAISRSLWASVRRSRNKTTPGPEPSSVSSVPSVHWNPRNPKRKRVPPLECILSVAMERPVQHRSRARVCWRPENTLPCTSCFRRSPTACARQGSPSTCCFSLKRGGRGLINFETAFERVEIRPSLRGLRRGWFYCGPPWPRLG